MPFCVKLYPQIKVEAVLFFFLIKLTYSQLLPYKTLVPKQHQPWNKKIGRHFFTNSVLLEETKKKEVSLWAKHLDSSCIASLLRLQRSKEFWCLVQGSCKKVLKVFHFFFFFIRKRDFSIILLFFFFLWAGHKFDELSKTQNQWVGWEFNVT